MKKILVVICAVLCFTGFLHATRTATAQAMRLSDVRRVYIEKMNNNLDQYLASSISEKFHGTLTVVLDQAQADAILKGENMAAQQTQNGTVQLVDKSGSTVLWSGSANDRSMLMLNLKHGGEKKLADHLIGELKKAMQPK
ncbi:MAG TPA: hypothetical protein VIM62_09850 [Acidobacteriaceae bacterium]